MTWRTDLRPASFRGVQFFISGHEFEGGRRGVQHEYVQRDNPYAEDTGRKGRKFTLEAYVLGENYFGARDALINALESAGPGDLVHPYLGQKNVQALDFRLRETSQDGGMATFTINFVEAGEPALPNAALDNREILVEATEDLFSKVNKAFEKAFSVLDKPQFVADKAKGKIDAVADKINGAAKRVGDAAQKVSDTQRKTEELKAKAYDLMRTPDKLANTIQDSFRNLQKSVTNLRTNLESFASFFGFGNDDKPVVGATPSRTQEAANQEALNQLIQITALGFAAQAAIDIPYESTEDAKLFRSQLLEEIEEQIERVADDDVYQALLNTKTELIRGVPAPEEQLPTIGKVALNRSLPSVVVTYDLYQDAKYEQDLIDRNKVSHPGFVPGGRELEVLEIV